MNKTSDIGRIKVAFFWQTFSSSNLGVGALAEGNLAVVRKACERAGLALDAIEFCHSERDLSAPQKHGVEVGPPMSLKRMLLGDASFPTALRQCQVAIDIGEGDSFADIYGFKRLLMLTASKSLCIKYKVPLVIAPQTIGPFESWWSRWMSRKVMLGATKVFARDGLSMAYLKSNVADARSDEVIDVAFRLPFTKGERFNTDGKTHIGINVSGLLYNGGYTQNNQFGLKVDYKKLIDLLLAQLAARDNTVLHLVGHVLSDEMPVEDDYKVISEIRESLPQVRLAPKFRTPSEAKSYISRLDFFTGARMHACIGAFSSGVAVVPMAYSRKFNGLFNSLGYGHIADLKAHTTEEALAQVMQGLAAVPQLTQEVAAGNALAQSKLQRYEDYLTQLFSEIRDGRH